MGPKKWGLAPFLMSLTYAALSSMRRAHQLLSLRGAQKIPHVVRNRLCNLIGKNCHCEERSDVAISTFFKRLLRFARNDTGTGVIATLPSVARIDMLSLTLG